MRTEVLHQLIIMSCRNLFLNVQSPYLLCKLRNVRFRIFTIHNCVNLLQQLAISHNQSVIFFSFSFLQLRNGRHDEQNDQGHSNTSFPFPFDFLFQKRKSKKDDISYISLCHISAVLSIYLNKISTFFFRFIRINESVFT